MNEVQVKVSLVTHTGETVMIKRVLIPLHFTSSAQLNSNKISVGFYPSYTCLHSGVIYEIIIAYVEANFPMCAKMEWLDPCSEDDSNICRRRNGFISEDNKVFLFNTFDDNKETPEKVTFTVTLKQPYSCIQPGYIQISIKESYEQKTVETAYVNYRLNRS